MIELVIKVLFPGRVHHEMGWAYVTVAFKSDRHRAPHPEGALPGPCLKGEGGQMPDPSTW